MYWDVVEVKPEADYRLFVRFKDGLAGHVQLPREKLTGVLAPLLDADFFSQVFIDDGAVAWPGEIDLAPDAMYAEVTFRNQLPRLYELKDLLTVPSHPDAYFQKFEDRLQQADILQTYAFWEQELKGLDPGDWEVLKNKAASYLQRKDKNGRGWQQLFDALTEAIAYNYLKKSLGCAKVNFIPESNVRTPDLEGTLDQGKVLCEVKTINISDAQIRARQEPPVAPQIYGQLSNEFMRKLDSDIANARNQLRSFDPDGNARHLALIFVCPDDWAPDRWDDYASQIKEHIRNHPLGVGVVAIIGRATGWTRIVAFPE